MGGGLSFLKKETAYEAPKKEPPMAGSINVYFASATGNAEKFAKAITRELEGLGFDADYFNLNEFTKEDILGCKRALFVASSSGEGQAPFECRPFMKWIENEDGTITRDALDGMAFSVFGLGNMEYRYYNKCGLDLDKHLHGLGGSRIMEVGLGDDSNGNLEDDFELWKDKMVRALMLKYHPKAATLGFKDEIISHSGSSKVPGKVRTEFRTVPLSAQEVAAEAAKPPRALSEISMEPSNVRFFTAPPVKVLVNRELRPEDAGLSTRHIELDLTDSGLQYQTADNVAILAENSAVVVEGVAKALGYTLAKVVRLQPKQMSAKASARRQVAIRPFAEPFPSPCSVRDILTRFMDLSGRLSQTLLLQLVPYITDLEQKSWLIALLSKDRKAEYKEFVSSTHPSLASLLGKELSSAEIPLTDLLHLVPYLQPRYYTIASSSTEHPSCVHMCCAWSSKNAGLCSTYLKELRVGGAVRVFIQDSTFRLPADPTAPIVMVGPGTGIAPMRALLQERYCQSVGAKVGSNTLYFGCKNSKQDFIYKDELVDYRDNKKILTKLHLAFSREDPKKKVYVQHLLADEENAKALIADLDKGGCIYVCGSTGMGKDVMEAVCVVLVRLKGLSADEAQAQLDTLVGSGRYVQELWG